MDSLKFVLLPMRNLVWCRCLLLLMECHNEVRAFSAQKVSLLTCTMSWAWARRLWCANAGSEQQSGRCSVEHLVITVMASKVLCVTTGSRQTSMPLLNTEETVTM